MSKSNFDDVKSFHARFGIDYSGPPRQLPSEWDWRRKFLDEELAEYDEAVKSGDLAKQFDALLDLVYVAMGTAVLQGFPWHGGWAEVQRANMAKRKAEPGEGRGSGDIRKPEGWRPPDIDEVIASAFEWHAAQKMKPAED